MRRLMTEVTQKEVTADTVNAAVGCVSAINNTIRTAILAAKFLSDK